MTKHKVLLIALMLIAFLAVGGLTLYAHQVPRRVQPVSLQVRQQQSTSQPATSETETTLKVATPSIGAPIATPSLIAVGTSTLVTVTAQITRGTPIPGGVNLLQLGPTGTQPTILGVMHDDGLNGDVEAGDGIYTLQIAFNQAPVGQIQLEIAAAFRGMLTRITSNAISVVVGSTFTDTSAGVTFVVPPFGDSSPSVIDRASPSGTLFTIQIGAVDPVDGLFHSLFRIFAFPNTSRGTLQAWFAENVDDSSGVLLSSGAFQSQQLQTGPALISAGPIPSSYQGGPVADAYALSPSGDRIYASVQSQDGQISDFGYDPTIIPALLLSVLASIK